MAQDTRKDPRAKVLTMTVRYKSATLDEFIEHHSYDVSRGGMFIKTPSPFPPGTLLKFEVKIADDQKLMQGVGRVVWKRESTEASPEKPAGMGVKFIKVDEESKRVIGQLVSSRGDDSQSAFDAGRASAAPPAGPPRPTPSTPAAKPTPSQPAVPRASTQPAPPPENPRKGTMIGLGAIAAKAAAEPEPEAPAPAAESSFFPETDSKKDLPPPEDRTVMKQAAELLEDALREAGGSMDEIGDTAAEPARPAAPAKASTPPATRPLSKVPDDEKTVSLKKSTSTPPNRRVEPAKRAASSPPAARASARPATRSSRAPSALQQTPAEEGGSGKAVWLILAAVLVGGGVYAFTKHQRDRAAADAAAASAAAAPEPPQAEPPKEEPKAEEPKPEPAEAPDAAAPDPEADAKAEAEKAEAEKAEAEKAEAEKAAAAKAAAEAAEAEAARKAAARAARAAAPKPKPAAPKPEPEPAGEAEPAPAPAPEAAPEPAPAPAPKPVAPTPPPAPPPVDENPY